MALAKVFVSQKKNEAEQIAGSLKTGSSKSTAILVITMILLVVGLANLYAITAFSKTDYFSGQFEHAILGLVVLGLVGFWVPVRMWKNYSLIIFSGTIVLLVLVDIVGHTTMGAQRWIGYGPLRFQPSEVAKIVTAIYVATFFDNNAQSTPYTFMDLVKVIAGVGAIFGLIFGQPDLGTAGVCLLIALGQVAFVRLDRKNLVTGILFGISSMVVGWFFLLHDYQKRRILTLFNPEHDRSGSGYNAFQSIVAIGSGQYSGKGFLQGSQAQLQFLPERQTDFIFAAFAEEHGFLGCAAVLVLFCALIYLALDVARHARNTFSQFLAIGIATFYLVEVAINCGMVMGLVPVVGVPLPFFSNGGSAMLTNCLAIGLLVSIDRETKGNNKPSLLGN
jgi:rod shape determining protein RodA